MVNAALTVKTEPAAEPLSLATVKAHLRIDPADNTEDTLLTAIIKASREYCESKQRRAFCKTVYIGSLDCVPYEAYNGGIPFRLPIQPLKSITSIKIKQVEDDGTQTDITVPASQYETDLSRGLIRLRNNFYTTIYDKSKLPSFACFQVEFIAGADTAGDPVETIPARTLQAMLLIIGHWYEHREDASDGFKVETIPTAADALLQQGKVY